MELNKTFGDVTIKPINRYGVTKIIYTPLNATDLKPYLLTDLENIWLKK